MTENTTASGQPHRWAKAIKDAYEEGCWAISTYNDEPTETVDEAWERSDARSDHDAALAAPAQPDWRELCRRLYVELFHCDTQMTCSLNEDGEPIWRTGTEVRDVLSDAKAALEANPVAPQAAPVAPAPQPAPMPYPTDAQVAAALAAAPPAQLSDGARYHCRKCGEQNNIEFNSARIVTLRPDGSERDPRDIASDPEGKLMHSASEPLRAAVAPAPQPPAGLLSVGVRVKVLPNVTRYNQKPWVGKVGTIHALCGQHDWDVCFAGKPGYWDSFMRFDPSELEVCQDAQPAPLQQGEYLPLAVASAPDRIWLDLGFDPKETDADFSDLNTPTWSADNASGHGIEYVRADLAQDDSDLLTIAYMSGMHTGKRDAARGAAQPDQWHQAVLDACFQVESCYVEADPVKTVNSLIDWHVLNERVAARAAPCPFCGSIGLDFVEGSTHRWGRADCSACGASTGEVRRAYPDDAKWHAAAIAEWNRRAPAPANGEDVSPFGYFRAEPFGWTDCAESDEGAKPLYEKPQAHSDLHAAAQALVDRWDTPKWKDADHTGAFIQRLREALAAPPAQEVRTPLTEKQISKLWSDAHNDTSDRMAHQVLVRLVEAEHSITAAQKETP